VKAGRTAVYHGVVLVGVQDEHTVLACMWDERAMPLSRLVCGGKEGRQAMPWVDSGRVGTQVVVEPVV
jgi:hypothetical protein